MLLTLTSPPRQPSLIPVIHGYLSLHACASTFDDLGYYTMDLVLNVWYSGLGVFGRMMRSLYWASDIVSTDRFGLSFLGSNKLLHCIFWDWDICLTGIGTGIGAGVYYHNKPILQPIDQVDIANIVSNLLYIWNSSLMSVENQQRVETLQN